MPSPWAAEKHGFCLRWQSGDRREAETDFIRWMRVFSDNSHDLGGGLGLLHQNGDVCREEPEVALRVTMGGTYM